MIAMKPEHLLTLVQVAAKAGSKGINFFQWVLDGQITDAQKGNVRVGSSRRQKMSKEKICGGLL
jgi:hypothetical protein